MGDLIVLSECFEVQFSVISTESLYWTHYPDDAKRYDHRVYLLYDGVHYDAVVGDSAIGEVRFFSPTDDESMDKVAELARIQQAADGSQYCLLYTCKLCEMTLIGQAELARHCFETGHQEFVEAETDDVEASDADEDNDNEKEDADDAQD